jgi:YD repeat-containing protein
MRRCGPLTERAGNRTLPRVRDVPLRSSAFLLFAIALAIVPGASSAIQIGATGCSVNLPTTNENLECVLTVPGGQLSLGGSPTITTGVPGGETATIAYDSAGRVVRTDVSGRATSYTYDSAGRLSAFVDPGGQTTTYEYDSLDRVVAAGDSRFVYSDAGLIRAALGEGDVADYTYDSVSNLISLNQGESHARFAYDAHRRVTDIDTTVGTIDYEYDGRALVRRVAGGVRTAYSYDQRGRLVRSADSDGQVVDYQYDRDGSLLRISSLGGVTSFSYDRGGRLTAILGSDGGVTQFAYGDAGLPTSVLPDVDDELVVGFEHGDLNAPVTIGYLWSDEDGPSVSLTLHGYLLTCSSCP